MYVHHGSLKFVAECEAIGHKEPWDADDISWLRDWRVSHNPLWTALGFFCWMGFKSPWLPALPCLALPSSRIEILVSGCSCSVVVPDCVCTLFFQPHNIQLATRDLDILLWASIAVLRWPLLSWSSYDCDYQTLAPYRFIYFQLREIPTYLLLKPVVIRFPPWLT